MKWRISVMMMMMMILISAMIIMEAEETEGSITSTAKRFVESVGEKIGFVDPLTGDEFVPNPNEAETLHTHTTNTFNADQQHQHQQPDFVENKAEQAKDKLGEMKEKAEDYAEHTKDYVQNFAGEMKEKMGNAKEKMGNFAENIKENSENFNENIKERMRSARDRVNENAENMKENTKYRMGNAKERVENFAENVKEKMGNVKEKMGNYAENIKENIVESTENIAGNVIEKMGSVKEKIGETAEKVLPKEVIDLADPISETFQSGVNKVKRNLDKAYDWKNKMTEKLMGFISQQEGGEMSRDEIKENDLIINWAKREGFEEIIPMIRAKHFDLDKLSTINTSNIKDELGVIDPSYANRIVDSIDLLFDDVGVTNVDENQSLL